MFTCTCLFLNTFSMFSWLYRQAHLKSELDILQLWLCLVSNFFGPHIIVWPFFKNLQLFKKKKIKRKGSYTSHIFKLFQQLIYFSPQPSANTPFFNALYRCTVWYPLFSVWHQAADSLCKICHFSDYYYLMSFVFYLSETQY